MSGLDNYNKERQLDKRERELEAREELLEAKCEILESDTQWLDLREQFLDDYEDYLEVDDEGKVESIKHFKFYKDMARMDIDDLKFYSDKYKKKADFYKKFYKNDKEISREYLFLAETQEQKINNRESFIKIIELEESKWQEANQHLTP